MKFLIVALCVAAASAAPPAPGAYQPFARAVPAWQRSAQAQVQVVPVAKTVPEVVVSRAASVVGSEVNAEVLRSEVDVKPDGFSYTYETQNGINAQASGALKKVDDTEAVVVQGSYKYVSPDGTPVGITYVADENGYQPQGDLLPVPPPVPEAILRSLEFIRAHPPPAAVVGQKY